MKDEITRDERVANLKGMGCSRKRVEDARFTQGKGNYVDDIKLPGMLHGDFVRSPYAHARVKSINIDAAMALPGVVAVLTAKDLEPLNLHWMPTLAGDKQMVLADGKVLFQGQEVAFVVANDRYIAADAVELVEVDYEELEVIVDPFKSLQSDVVLREDLVAEDGSIPTVRTATQAPQSHLHMGSWRRRGHQSSDRQRRSRCH
jgi:Aerobic-type carbon monoxide dehydrogenase, large subunit CoxL/CutL homologs